MKKINKISISLLILSGSLLMYFFIFSNKIDTVQTANSKSGSDQVAIDSKQSLVKSIKEQEGDYVVNIEKITNEYQNFINSINSKIEGASPNPDGAYSLFDASDTLTVTRINQNLIDTRVPAKFKEFHLLLSRSLLKFTIYAESSDPDDILTGLDLYSQAITKYKDLYIS